MHLIDKSSSLWQYLSIGQKGLFELGMRLIEERDKYPDPDITDYSYMVFPFAKAYEGFLKQLFLDKGYISEYQYQGTHFRIGRALNPHLEKKFHDELIFEKLAKNGGRELAEKLWECWKDGRNLVFHYFPHNIRSLSQSEAREIIMRIIDVMTEAINTYDVQSQSGR